MSYIDSSGMGQLLALQMSCIAVGRRLRLAAITADLMRVLRITKLDKVFEHFESLEEALSD